ncbi:MAG: VanZ family protein [Clostridia bacterium]|nr:VanZ family protein [Clostridia bacterium]
MSRLAYSWFPVFAWLAFIAYLSSLPHIFITDLPYLVPAVEKLFGIDLTAVSHEAARQANFLFRKALHVLVYFVLGFLLFRATASTRAPRPFILTLLILALIAAGDEYNQYFNPERTSKLSDVLLDVTGGLTGAALLATYHKTRRRVPRR